MRLVTRDQWGARARRGQPSRLSTDLVTIHWEGPTMGVFSHGRCPAKVRQIQDYHMDVKGWTDIAYSAVVCPHDSVYEGRGPGVRTGANGTNVGNDSALAVCALVGEGDPITDALLDGITDAVAWLGGKRTNAHRDWKPTACPGDVLAFHAHSGRFLRTPSQPQPSTPPEEELTMADITQILNAVEQTKPVAVRLASSGKHASGRPLRAGEVWIISGAGMWHVDRPGLNALAVVGAVRGLRDLQPVGQWSAEQVASIPIIPAA